MTMVTTRSQASSMPAAGPRLGGSAASAGAGAAPEGAAATGAGAAEGAAARALPPETGIRGDGGAAGPGSRRAGGASRGAPSSRLSWSDAGRAPAAGAGSARIWRSASSTLAMSVSMDCGRGRRLARTTAISSSTRGYGERRISTWASSSARRM